MIVRIGADFGMAAMCACCLGASGLPRASGSGSVEEDSAERAKRYREHAAEIHAAARIVTHPPSREALLRLAETYSRLAAKIEAERNTTEG
jgi:hypothetical protein